MQIRDSSNRPGLHEQELDFPQTPGRPEEEDESLRAQADNRPEESSLAAPAEAITEELDVSLLVLVTPCEINSQYVNDRNGAKSCKSRD